MPNSDFRTRITSLYGSQTSPIIFLIKSGDFRTRIASLYGSQPSSVVFACKPRLLDLNYKSLWVPDLTYGFVHVKNVLAAESLDSTGPKPQLSFCACKATRLASELLVSMGPSPHLWFLHAKQRLSDQNYKSLWVPDLIYYFFN